MSKTTSQKLNILSREPHYLTLQLSLSLLQTTEKFENLKI